MIVRIDRHPAQACRGIYGAALLFVAASVWLFVPGANAQETVVKLDPAATKIEFTLGATLHTVHGTFHLKSGEIRFDPATGKASGLVIADATSGNTDNSSRDKKMHAEILESAKYPEIVFTPTQVTGSLANVLSGKGAANIQLTGSFQIHGQSHDATLVVTIDPAAAGQESLLRATSNFPVPFVKWGLKNPSTFFLHVSDTVNVDIHATARIYSSGH